MLNVKLYDQTGEWLGSDKTPCLVNKVETTREGIMQDRI
jgi:hypothetical protein